MAAGHETPTYPQYTNLALHDGLFDQLLAAHEYHLNIQYDKQRIKGDLYAKVYLGSMESVLQNTTPDWAPRISLKDYLHENYS